MPYTYLIRGLPSTTSSSDLEKYFSRFASVSDARMTIEPVEKGSHLSRRVGVVSFPTAADHLMFGRKHILNGSTMEIVASNEGGSKAASHTPPSSANPDKASPRNRTRRRSDSRGEDSPSPRRRRTSRSRSRSPPRTRDEHGRRPNEGGNERPRNSQLHAAHPEQPNSAAGGTFRPLPRAFAQNSEQQPPKDVRLQQGSSVLPLPSSFQMDPNAVLQRIPGQMFNAMFAGADPAAQQAMLPLPQFQSAAVQKTQTILPPPPLMPPIPQPAMQAMLQQQLQQQQQSQPQLPPPPQPQPQPQPPQPLPSAMYQVQPQPQPQPAQVTPPSQQVGQTSCTPSIANAGLFVCIPYMIAPAEYVRDQRTLLARLNPSNNTLTVTSQNSPAGPSAQSQQRV